MRVATQGFRRYISSCGERYRAMFVMKAINRSSNEPSAATPVLVLVRYSYSYGTTSTHTLYQYVSRAGGCG